MNRILIADSGSSKTDWALAAANGETLKEWQSPGINPFFQDADTIEALLNEVVFPQLAGSEPATIAFYGAGCADPAINAPLKGIFGKQYKGATVGVESDLLGAARSLCGHEKGIACILGTGANNCLYDGREIVGNIGSLGFWMGDEGSGGYLGKRLVISFLHKELPENLSAAFSEKYPGVNRLEILDKAYRQPFPNRYFARYTHFLSEQQGDAFVDRFLEEAFLLFLEKYVCKHPHADRYPVSFTGSVAWIFQQQLLRAVGKMGLQPGKIEQRPMPGLIRYHLPGNG
ncbi:ATPase [Ravibacter arvi]|uniref:ATPase n=1 Tax=Ravibacter arvi TaxID=2051041 RepID=A0ABP8LV71_9BACT